MNVLRWIWKHGPELGQTVAATTLAYGAAVQMARGELWRGAVSAFMAGFLGRIAYRWWRGRERS